MPDPMVGSRIRGVRQAGYEVKRNRVEANRVRTEWRSNAKRMHDKAESAQSSMARLIHSGVMTARCDYHIRKVGEHCYRREPLVQR